MGHKEIRIGIDKSNNNNNIVYAATIGSILLSLATVRKNPSLSSFFGLWAPTILGLSILFKENQILERTRGLSVV